MNPVVFRRTFAGLRDAGIVHSEKGHGGDWAFARVLDSVTPMSTPRWASRRYLNVGKRSF